MKGLVKISLLAQLFFAPVVWAQAPATSLSAASTTRAKAKTVAPVKKAPVKNFGISFSAGRSQNLYRVEGKPYASSWDYALAPSYSLGSDFTVSGVAELSQNIEPDQDSDWGRVQASISKSNVGLFKRRTLLTFKVSGGLPADRESKRQSSQGTLSASVRADSNPDYMAWKPLSLALTLSGSRYFHQYDTAISGKVNNQYGSAQTGEMGIDFTDRFSLKLTASHINRWTYGGVLKEYIMHGQELGFKISEAFSADLGHQYGNPMVSIWKENGQDYNFNATDDQNSIVYAHITYTY